MSRIRAACGRKTRSLFENKESQKICGFSGFQFSRKVTERAHPAPLRGAAAAAAEGPSNRRSEKNAFSEAASIFPLRLLLWGLKGASSPFFVRGEWSPEDERGASKRPSCPLAQRSVPPFLKNSGTPAGRTKSPQSRRCTQPGQYNPASCSAKLSTGCGRRRRGSSGTPWPWPARRHGGRPR